MDTSVNRHAAAEERMRTVADLLWHPDPAQLLFQIIEIAGEQTYLRHGVRVGPGDVVVDVGANVGVAAAFFGAICGAQGVHSLEPIPPIFEILRRNVARTPGCVAHPIGLGARDGRTEMTYYPRANAMSGAYADPERDRELVRAVLLARGTTPAEAERQLAGRYEAETLSCELRTASTFLREQRLDHVDLLKIDVERAELDVLAGIAAADWPQIRQVVIEVHDEHGRGALIADLLARRGFRTASEQEPAMRPTAIRMLYATRARRRAPAATPC
jgi:FkbM family methyltransferase